MDQLYSKRVSYASLLVGMSCLLELLAVLVWFNVKQWPWPVFIHSCASLLLIVNFLLRSKRVQKVQWEAVHFFGLILMVIFPIIGWFAGLFLIIWVIKGQDFKSGVYQEYEDYIEQEAVSKYSGNLYLRRLQELRSDVGFETYIDIIKGDNNTIKQRVMEKLSRNVSPHSVKLLKTAISDSSAEIRLCAANGLLKIEKTVNDKIQTALMVSQQRGAPQDYTNLGDLYFMYSNLGLMEEKSAHHYLSLACAAFEQSLDMNTDQINVIKDYAKILIALGDYTKARKLLDSSNTLWKDDVTICLLRAEAYFLSRDFLAIESILKGVSQENIASQQHSTVEFWQSA